MCPQTCQAFVRAFVFSIPFVLTFCQASSFLSFRSQFKCHLLTDVLWLPILKSLSLHLLQYHITWFHFLIAIKAISEYLNLFNYLFIVPIEYEFHKRRALGPLCLILYKWPLVEKLTSFILTNTVFACVQSVCFIPANWHIYESSFLFSLVLYMFEIFHGIMFYKGKYNNINHYVTEKCLMIWNPSLPCIIIFYILK